MIGYKSNLQYCVLVEECEIKLKLGVEIFNFLWARCSLWCIGLREYNCKAVLAIIGSFLLEHIQCYGVRSVLLVFYMGQD